jgi:hypothetical protein
MRSVAAAEAVAAVNARLKSALAMSAELVSCPLQLVCFEVNMLWICCVNTLLLLAKLAAAAAAAVRAGASSVPVCPARLALSPTAKTDRPAPAHAVSGNSWTLRQ